MLKENFENNISSAELSDEQKREKFKRRMELQSELMSRYLKWDHAEDDLQEWVDLYSKKFAELFEDYYNRDSNFLDNRNNEEILIEFERELYGIEENKKAA